MEKTENDKIKKLPIEFLIEISEILNDSGKFKRIDSILEKSALTFESDIFRKQFTIQSRAELKELRKSMNEHLESHRRINTVI